MIRVEACWSFLYVAELHFSRHFGCILPRWWIAYPPSADWLELNRVCEKYQCYLYRCLPSSENNVRRKDEEKRKKWRGLMRIFWNQGKKYENFAKIFHVICIIFPLSNKLIAKPGDKLSNSLHNIVSCITVIRRHNCSYRIRHNAYLSKSLYTTSSLSSI